MFLCMLYCNYFVIDIDYQLVMFLGVAKIDRAERGVKGA